MNTKAIGKFAKSRIGLVLAASAIVLLGATPAAWAQPQVVITCGQPANNGNVDVTLFKYADAQGTHGTQCTVSAAILATDTAEQKAQKIADAINNSAPPCGVTAAVNGTAVTVTDPAGKGVICTKFEDGSGEPCTLSTGTGATLSGTGIKWQLYGNTTTGSATIGVDGNQRTVLTEGKTITEIYEEWQALFGEGTVEPDGFLLPVDALWPHDLTLECTDPGLVIAFEQPLIGSIPTVSEWGLIILTLLLLTAGTIVIARQRRAMAA